MYNRELALKYAKKWAFSRNPQFYDFEDIGGDCTNFVSQCIYAGCGIMNYTPTFGWYYISSYDRSPSWAGASYFYNFITENEADGPYGTTVDIAEVMPGDVIQFGDGYGDFYHTVFIVQTGKIPSKRNIRIAAHSYDAYMRPLCTYSYNDIRFIHIEGCRE